MSIKTTTLSIAIAMAFLAPQVCIAQKTSITAKGFAGFIKKKIQSKQVSCIMDSQYHSPFNIDDYRCGKTENLKKKLPYHLYQPDYPYMIFRVMWYYESEKTIKTASKKEKILYGLNIEFVGYNNPKDTSTKETFIIDYDSKFLWKILEKYTCFHMHNDMTVSEKTCKTNNNNTQ